MFNAVSAVFQPFEEKKIIKRLKLIWFSHLVLDDLLFINQFFFTFSWENRNILSRKGGGGQPLSDSPSKISHTVANYMYVPSKNHDSFWSRVYKTKLCLTKKNISKISFKKNKNVFICFHKSRLYT